MLTNHLTAEQVSAAQVGPGVGFGLGFSVAVDLPATGNLGSVGMAGWAGINNTFFRLDPAEELFFILVTQFSPFMQYRIPDTFQTLVYQSIIK